MPLIDIDDESHFPSRKFWDTADTDFHASGDANTSLIVRVGRAIQVTVNAGGDSVELQVRVDADAPWMVLETLTGFTEYLRQFDPRWNFLRLVRTSGGAASAWSQE